MACRVKSRGEGGEGSKERGALVGPRAASLGAAILIRLSADARACGSVLLSYLARRALLAAKRMSMLMDLGGK